MKVHFISYGDDKFVHSRNRIRKEATSCNWFDTIKVYNKDDISQEFQNKYKMILDKERGGGYYIWKLDIIEQRLCEIEDGDMLVYIDCGCFINKNGYTFFKECLDKLTKSEYGIISFETNWLEREYTTKQIFDFFDVQMDMSGQYLSGILIMKICNHLNIILQQAYDALNTKPYLFTDEYNILQDEHFKDNRHDQSILSIIRKKYGSIPVKNNVDGYIVSEKDLNDNHQIIKQIDNHNYVCVDMHSPFWALRIRR